MKIRINGETFDYDDSKRPMSEALAIEKAWGRRYAEWETERGQGSAEAMAVLAWIIWRRDGRDVELKDILEGSVDFDLNEMFLSMAAAQEESQQAAEVPTNGAAPRTDPDGTGTTPNATSRSSRKSSG